ncbi:hypothetical protein [Rhizobium leguminosarum]|uniref:hypothetical protein n=1 Tax=Rhizobium leguminosarum TaxID=384 RepID=UPI0015DA0C95|nr:hypothetical protein [Rhizobium leguminosarum]NZD54188.1 hypothetical protein [Rhizobium leguminosarum]
MGTTIANPENIQAELEKLKSFYEAQQKILLEQQEEVERVAAEKREVEQAANRAERHAEADASARQLMVHTAAIDKLLAEVSEHLRARVELAREIRRIAPEKWGAGNVFEHNSAPSSAITHSGVGYYLRMPVRGGLSLSEHDLKFLQVFDLTEAKPTRKGKSA